MEKTLCPGSYIHWLLVGPRRSRMLTPIMLDIFESCGLLTPFSEDFSVCGIEDSFVLFTAISHDGLVEI